MTATDAIDLLRRITPEYSGPIYVALTSDEGFPESHRMPGADGFTSTNLDAALSPFLADKFVGRGGAMVIDDVAMRGGVAKQCGDDTALTDRLVDQRILATCIHEWAHCIDAGIDLRPITPPVCEVLAKKLVRVCAAPEKLDVPWQYHDCKFIRILLHMLWRVEQCSERIPENLAFSNDLYGLSTIWAFKGALGDEPAACKDMPFETIKTLPLPASYADLWRQDVTRWHRAKLAEINQHYGAALAEVGPGFSLEVRA